MTPTCADRDHYVLPGDRVFPEGITEGPDGTFFVGSTSDGTLFRIAPGKVEADVWSLGGVDDRTELLGLAVARGRRLVACGGSTGALFVYDVETAELLGRRDVPAERSLLNDVATDGDHAWVTDSSRPLIWRLPLDVDGAGTVGEPEVLVDLATLGAPQDSFLNGIVVEEGLLLVAAQGEGTLWRVDARTGEADRVDLHGVVFGADGLLLHQDHAGGTFLVGLTNEGESRDTLTFGLTVLHLSPDRRSARLVSVMPLDAALGFDSPTTLAAQGDRLLVVCGQVLHPDDPRPPFVVRVVPLPFPDVVEP
ncbi:MAG: hypothetical protein ACTHJ6_10360 [Oryzihumus sp.]